MKITDENKWIEWKGGKCPVPPETIVEVKFDDGYVASGDFAEVWDWRAPIVDMTIVAYRVVERKS